MARFCPNCGAELNSGADVCLKCGKNVTRNSNDFSNQGKSKVVAGLLGIFLGALGIHNFYLGYTGKAVAQLLITLLSCGFLAFASSIWGIIEGILILTGSIDKDAQGNPLSN
jgi:TM2 domain-containing membrane protein YozV